MRILVAAALPLMLRQCAGQFGSTVTSDFARTRTTIDGATSVIATPTGAGEPCAQVSDLQKASQTDILQLSQPRIQASLANACGDSVPINEQDATDLIDALVAMLQFQSTIDVMRNPPLSYPIAPIDLIGGLESLREKVTNGEYTSEVAFETDITTLIGAAHEGHLIFYPDALTIFSYGHQFGPLVSVSEDGIAAPKLYLYREMQAFFLGAIETPSAVERINGEDANEYITRQSLNSSYQGYQDADASYNAFLWSPNLGTGYGADPGLFTGSLLTRLGNTTSIGFANGTVIERENFARPAADFDSVKDGASFYDTFCNSEKKQTLFKRQREHTIEEMYERWKQGGYWQPSTRAKSQTRRQAQNRGPISNYPEPEVISSDGSISGYFLNDAGFQDVAILLVRSFSIDDQEDFQDTLTTFLDSCRSNNKERLIIDMTGNPGGVVGLGYDMFKQLFPTIDPWAANNFRAHEGYQLLGKSVTDISTAVLRNFPDSYELFEQAFGTTPFAAETKLQLDGARWDDFATFYGPVQASKGRGNYTNQFRLDLDNPEFSESFSGIVISGFNQSMPLKPQPFDSANMIMLTDGQCSSTCAAVAHLLKWQGKVKAIAMGGRPQTGAMQTVGGTKGTQVQTFQQLYAIAFGTYLVSNGQTRDSWLNTSLDTIMNLGEYLQLRTRSAGNLPSELAFNIQNNIAEGDRSLTPLQFVYEAADCRLYYQMSHIRDVSTRWTTAAAQAFGLRNTSVFSGCVEGSTDHPTSLSGNPELYNNGQPTNVTRDTPDFEIAGVGDDDPSSEPNGDGGVENSATQSAAFVPILALIVALSASIYVI